MSWPFVGRAEQLARIDTALRAIECSPIVITGAPGMGRTSLLSHVFRKSTVDPRAVVRLTPADAAVGAAELARAPARDSPPVVVLDDAHLADHESMLLLRTLGRQGRARLVVTRPADQGPVPGPDPTDCLCYERDVVTVRLPPLRQDETAQLLAAVLGERVHPATVAALHAAAGGGPRALRGLVTEGNLLDCLVARPGGWRLREPARPIPAPLADADADRLEAAARQAWRALALDQAEELCHLAGWRGARQRVAPVWASVLLLRGHAERALRVLDGIAPADHAPHLALVRAAALGLSTHRSGAASDYLIEAARVVPALRHRAPAYRAWLLAIAGRRVRIPAGHGDRQATTFADAAAATVALADGRAAAAVGHLRRALAAAEGCRDDLPWLPPYLMACLIDALLLAGRIREATETAREFHAGTAGHGWDIAVVIATLAGQATTAPVVRTTTEGMTTG